MRKLIFMLLTATIFACSENSTLNETTPGNITAKIETETQVKKNTKIRRQNKGHQQSIAVTESGPEELISLESLYNSFSQPDFFKINNYYDQVLTTKKGTVIRIPALCFKSQDINFDPESVQISVAEFYNNSDFILANLSTTSNGKILETGGMLRILAFSGDEKLQLKEGSEITLEVPNDAPEDGMELFYGNHSDDGHLNWETTDQKISLGRNRRPLKRKPRMASVMKETKIISNEGNSITSYKYTHPLRDEAKQTETSSLITLSFELNRKGEITDKKIRWDEKDISNKKVYLFRNKNSFTGKASQLELTDKFDFNHHFKISFTRPERPVYEFSISESEMNEVKSILRKEGKAKLVFVHEYIPEDTIITNPKREQEIKNKQIEDKLNTSGSDETISGIEAEELSAYIFSIKKLDWINIDRFNKEQGKTVTVAVNESSQKQTEVNTKLVFRDINAVLPGYSNAGKTEFKNVPQGKNATIVSIKIENGKTYFAMSNFITGFDVNPDLNYVALTPTQLKEKLKSLD